MKTQVREDLNTSQHKLIGELMVEMGFMSQTQVNEVRSFLRKIRLILGFYSDEVMFSLNLG
jgi:hypothetical protein